MAPAAAHVARPVPSEDIAAHHDVVDPGPRPVVRAVLGLALGAAAGAVAALLIPRPDRVRRRSALAARDLTATDRASG